MRLLALASLLIWKQSGNAIPPEIGICSGFPNNVILLLDADGTRRLLALDSGSSTSYLSPVSKSSKRVSPAVDWKLGLHGSPLATVHAQLEGGQYPLQNVRPRLFGSLGTDFLRQVVLMVDARSGRFAIWPADRCSLAEAMDWAHKNPDWAGATEFEGEWHNQKLGVSEGCETVPVSIDSDSLDPILDTGSSVSALSRERLNQVRHWSLFQETIYAFSEQTYYPFYLVPGIRTGFLQEPLSVVMSQNPDLDGFDGTYGLDFLNQGQWILDERGQMFAFKRYKPDGYLHLRTPGFYLFWKQDGVWVQLCDDMSAFAIAKADKLVSIDGKPLTGVLDFPIGDPIRPDDLAMFGHELHDLFSHPFVMRLNDGKHEQNVSADPFKWFN